VHPAPDFVRLVWPHWMAASAHHALPLTTQHLLWLAGVNVSEPLTRTKPGPQIMGWVPFTSGLVSPQVPVQQVASLGDVLLPLLLA
jgi:hypothetical protein